MSIWWLLGVTLLLGACGEEVVCPWPDSPVEAEPSYWGLPGIPPSNDAYELHLNYAEHLFGGSSSGTQYSAKTTF